jgi:hypothetical protein
MRGSRIASSSKWARFGGLLSRALATQYWMLNCALTLGLSPIWKGGLRAYACKAAP